MTTSMMIPLETCAVSYLCYDIDARLRFRPLRCPQMRVTCVGIVVLLSLSSLAAPLEPDFPPPFYPDKTKLLVYRDADGKEHPVNSAADWAKRRAHILANMQEVMGPLPDD